MGYILQLTSYNDNLSFGPTEGETISQSFTFGKSFILNSITVRFGLVTIDPADDLKIRCEIRKAYGSDYLLDMDDDPLMLSEWVNEEDISHNSYYQFPLDRSELTSGTYFFSFVSNIRIKYPIFFSFQKGGSFRGKFIKIINGSGIYRTDRSLIVKIDGVFGSISGRTFVHETDVYTSTVIQDRL